MGQIMCVAREDVCDQAHSRLSGWLGNLELTDGVLSRVDVVLPHVLAMVSFAVRKPKSAPADLFRRASNGGSSSPSLSCKVPDHLGSARSGFSGRVFLAHPSDCAVFFCSPQALRVRKFRA